MPAIEVHMVLSMCLLVCGWRMAERWWIGRETNDEDIGLNGKHGRWGTRANDIVCRYTLQKNFHGWTFKHATRLGMTLGAFGGVAGVFAIFFFAEVPKVRNDIMVKVPIIGQHFVKEIPASDNPF
ncbi:hypothetical protein ONS95_009784 [Cadophora gregata]|uniref:uncharacterized protein n=1 Tax=Cadophora gregata TaxID=51156 RepID=UPI0026DDC405|nr:uncharacterized protein ONS95_009784 [Cadophora gregata]KAK0121490.1 hypothetical protein ONS95_009784 [Cadophora gregata]